MNWQSAPPVGERGRRKLGRAAIQAVIVLVLLGGAAAGWVFRDQLLGGATGGDARQRGGGRAVTVDVAPAVSGTIVRSVEAVGTVIANEAITVTPKVAGVVSRINFTEGQWVDAGQALVEFDNREALAELAAAKAVEDNARGLFERTRTLLEQRNASQARFDEVASALKVAQARVKVVESQIADLRVTAPFRGKVGLRRVSVGALVTPGTVITTLDDVETVKLDFSVPEPALAAIRVGQEVQGRSEAYEGRLFTGTVRTIDSRVDPSTRAVNVRAHLPNPDGMLKPGMFLTVNLVVERHEGAVLIAEEALVPIGTRQYVFLVVDGKAARREVEIGQRRPGEVEILKGLAVGDRVVVGGLQKIREGTAVTVSGGGAGAGATGGAGGGRRPASGS